MKSKRGLAKILREQSEAIEDLPAAELFRYSNQEIG